MPRLPFETPGDTLQREGINRVSAGNGAWLEKARRLAYDISNRRGWVTSDDVQLADLSEPTHHNCYGAIFKGEYRGGQWLAVGSQISERPTAHSRLIRRWKYVTNEQGRLR